MKASTVVWAKQHDWYVGSLELIGGDWMVIVRDEALDTTTGIWHRVTKEFTSYQKLRAWAGY